jgi:hypothetical protein
MRTTLSIDDDVLAAAKALAAHEGRSTGEVISDLARRSLAQSKPKQRRNGFPVLPARPGGAPVTLEIVNALRDEMP